MQSVLFALVCATRLAYARRVHRRNELVRRSGFGAHCHLLDPAGIAPTVCIDYHGQLRQNEQRSLPSQVQWSQWALLLGGPASAFAASFSNGLKGLASHSLRRRPVDEKRIAQLGRVSHASMSLEVMSLKLLNKKRAAVAKRVGKEYEHLFAAAAARVGDILHQDFSSPHFPIFSDSAAKMIGEPLTTSFGTSLIPASKTERLVSEAIDAGYRSFETAQLSDNEEGVGMAINAAIESGELTREDVFVSLKVRVDNMGHDETFESVFESAVRLDLEGGIDLVLVRWSDEADAKLMKDTWTALERLQRIGVVKQLGVANCEQTHLRELIGYAEVPPAVNQFEVHPMKQRTDLVDFCHSEGIHVNTFHPVGGEGRDALLNHESLKLLAKAHSKSVPEIVFRWHLQRGVIPVPRSKNPSHMINNFKVFDFELNQDDMKAIGEIDKDKLVVLSAADESESE